MNVRILIGLLFLAFTPPTLAEPATPPAIGIDDIKMIKSPGDPQLSPDGRLVAYSLDDRIYVAGTRGESARAVTVATSEASDPRWANDGSALYFLSDRSGNSQLWRLPVNNWGEAEQLSTFERGIDMLAFSPDQSRLLLRLDDSDSAAAEDAPKEPWVIDRLQFKQDADDGYMTARPSDHYYAYDIEAGKLAPITSGIHTESDAAWSPDGKKLVFVSNREEEPDATYRSDLWLIGTDADGDMSALTRLTDSEHVDSAPAFSPDGRSIAWLSASDGVYGIQELHLMSLDTGETRNLSADLDRWVRDFHYSADGAWIYLNYYNHGGSSLARIRVRDGHIDKLIEGERNVSAFDVDERGTVVVRMNGQNDADNIYVYRNGRLEALTAINDEILASRSLGSKEKVSYTIDDGTVVESFITRPPDYVAGKRYPTVLKIHGGPVGQFSWGYDFETQFLASNGYVVLEPNPRGSTGHGQDFVRAIYRSWGITDYPDIMGAVDHAIDAGIADPQRLYVTGYSYGGYMTNVVITETDRFRAAASGAGHAHLIANYGHDIYQKWYNWEFGLPTRNRKLYDRLSPLLRADRVTTPTLFLGGREDWNVPVLSAELFYQVLKTLGVDTRLVVYPDSHHGGWEDRFQQDYLKRMVAWFDNYGGKS